jgi:hypothetical protein
MDNSFIIFPVSCLGHMLGRMILSSYSSCCNAGLFGLTCHLHKFGDSRLELHLQAKHICHWWYRRCHRVTSIPKALTRSPLGYSFIVFFSCALFPIRQVTAQVALAVSPLPKACLWLGVGVILEPVCRGQFPTV